MLTLNEDQEKLASRASTQLVMFAKLDTFTDHAAQTIDETFFWATVPITYKWDGSTAVQFKGVLKSVSPIIRGFPHIPNARLMSTRDGLTIELDASKWADEFPWQRLIAKNLIGAHIEVDSLLVDWGSPLPDNWKDQTTLGGVHNVRFRGEVTAVPEYNDERNVFTLVCESVEVPLPWGVALDPLEVSAKDLGVTYPIPVGDAKRIPLVQRQVGRVTTLAAYLDPIFLGIIEVTDTFGFPPAPAVFPVMIGTERLDVSVLGPTSLRVDARGTTVGAVTTLSNGHEAGAQIVEELQVARFVYSGVENTGLTTLYARSPASGDLIRIPEGNYGFSPADKELDTGLTLGVISFTPELWTQVVQVLNAEAAILEQPGFAIGIRSLNIPFADTSDPSFPNLHGDPPWHPTTASIITGGAKTNIQDVPESFTQESAYFGFLDGDITGNLDDVIIRVRVTFEYTITSGTGTGDDANAWVRIRFGNIFENEPGGIGDFALFLAAGESQEVRQFDSGWLEMFPSPPSSPMLVEDLMSSGFFLGPGKRTVELLSSTPKHDDNVNAMEVSILNASMTLDLEVQRESLVLTQPVVPTGGQELGFNLDLFADVSGALTVGSESSEGEFDIGTAWTGTDATITDVGGAGDGFKMTGDGTDVLRTAALASISPALDFATARMKFDYLIDSASMAFLDLTVSAFRITLKSAADDWITWSWPVSSLYATGWREFLFDPTNSIAQIFASDGTLDLSSVTDVHLEVVTADAASLGDISFRDLRIEQVTPNTHPIDIAQWLIEENAGITNGVDATTFSVAKSNLPNVVFGGDLRRAGSNMGEVLARLGFECRTNFVLSEVAAGSVFKAFNALFVASSFVFSIPGLVIGEFNSLKTRTKQLDEQPNEFVGLYDFRNHLNQNDVQGFAALVQANALVNDVSALVPTSDITDAQTRVGVRAAEDIAFVLLPDASSAEDVFAYYAQESLRGSALRFVLSVPYRYGYAMETGDIIAFTPRWSSSIKCRVIQVRFLFDSPSIELSLEEVL